mmetsp:Transcript_6642/g.5748  ORF Transcript_6642/g.5748 Transcript_6642/m.5748 type:complete len:282 (+) Transcript_6642:19-864(+)
MIITQRLAFMRQFRYVNGCKGQRFGMRGIVVNRQMRYFSSQNFEKMNKQDYYQLLGVKRDSNQDKIKENYLKLALQHHPDTKDGSDENFKLISEAYNILSNTREKSKYDASIGNYEPTINPYEGMTDKEYKYKKEHDLSETEEKLREDQHDKILMRKHKREQERLKFYMSNYTAKGIEERKMEEMWVKEYQQLQTQGKAEKTLEDYILKKKNEEKEKQFDNHASVRRSHLRTNKLNHFTFRFSKLYMIIAWIPISYAIYLYLSEVNDLEITAREFTAFKKE